MIFMNVNLDGLTYMQKFEMLTSGKRTWFDNIQIGYEFEGPREATRGGGGEWEPNQILLQELTYVPSSIPKSKTLQ
jgi:hypothetical protein